MRAEKLSTYEGLTPYDIVHSALKKIDIDK